MADSSVKKFIDLVRRVSGKWTNWDPPIPVTVGSYGTLADNGEFSQEGDIYKDRAILDSLNEAGLDLLLKENRPAFGEPDQDLIVSSAGVKKGQLTIGQSPTIPLVASASIKGTWKFQVGKRGALVILHKPRQAFLPKIVLAKLLQVKHLEGKYIVTSAFSCPAYLLYLSDKAGESFSVAFSAPAAGSIEAGWWTDTETAFLRRGFSQKGDSCFIPLFSLQEKVKPSWLRWRGEEGSHSLEEYVWQDVYPAWKPLDEDGREIED